MGHGTPLVSYDVIRREMLKVHDRDGNLSIDLIRQIAEYGKDKCEFFIVGGASGLCGFTTLRRKTLYQ
ncbi:hypothetical protein J6TS2_44530 [Heyndrickxia sporothermodurans]|nr:hypothetical protein J6TS2_44530 [Heyndrickxia sporothermodurans]